MERIKNNNKVKKTAFTWHSDYFYAHNIIMVNYKISFLIYAASVSDGKNSYLSVFLHLIKGTNDDKQT